MEYNQNWLVNEEALIKRAIRKKKKDDNLIMTKLLMLITLLTCSYLTAEEEYFTCPHCDELVEMSIKAVKKGKWKCPNCDYENDNRIVYCGLCGSDRDGNKK
jgi:ribosomal protein L37AE/L43A